MFEAIHLAFVIIALSNAANGCSDESFCSDAFLPYCETSDIVKNSCPVLCGLCPTAPDCVDNDENCPSWKRYCKTSSWMEDNCKKTCNLCGDSAWSQCTRTCGGGTRFRKNCVNDDCEYTFEACSTNACPNISDCGYQRVKRYGMHHACCTPDNTLVTSWGKCGTPTLTGERVFGGKNAKAKQWSWMVAVVSRNEFCGGVIISTRYILTAAHCLEDGARRKYEAKDVLIYAGLLRLSDASGAIRVKKIIQHPQFNFPRNDIALIKLRSKLVYSSTVRPICLPGGEITPTDSTCHVVGWGKSEHSGDTTTNHLQEAALKNLDRRICARAYKTEFNLQHLLPFLNGKKNYLCAGSLVEMVDSCLGDSGAPLLCQRCSSCDWYVAGVVSAGSDDCGKLGVPGIYTEVREYEAWISQEAGVSHSPKSCQDSNAP